MDSGGHRLSFFAGGEIQEGQEGSDSARVDVWNHSAHSWSYSGDILSQPRKKLAAAAAGGVLAVGGGYRSGQKAKPDRGYSDVVDLWHDGAWSQARLSQPRQYITAAAARDVILFGGGFCSPCVGQNGTDRSDVVDLYNITSRTWSTHTLSERRSNLAATTVGDRWVLFIGGTTDVDPPPGAGIRRSSAVDVFDALSGGWRTLTLSSGRCCLGASGGANMAAILGSGSSADEYYFRPGL